MPTVTPNAAPNPLLASTAASTAVPSEPPTCWAMRVPVVAAA
jgi:hypothetical protein